MANNLLVQQNDTDIEAEENVPSSSTATSRPSSSLKASVWVMNLLLLFIVTGCLVLSKLMIVERIGNIDLTVDIVSNTAADKNSSNNTNTNRTRVYRDRELELKSVVNTYWQILIIMMVPNVLCCIQSAVGGHLTQSSSHPWPRKSALLTGVVIAAVEASSECSLVFLVLASLPPGIVIFLMSGLFSVQGVFDATKRFKQLCRHSQRRGYEPIGEITDQLPMKKHELHLILLSSLAGILAQAIGVSSSIYFIYHYTLHKMERWIAYFIPVCLFILSSTWASEVQKYTFVASEPPSDASEKKENPGLKRVPPSDASEKKENPGLKRVPPSDASEKKENLGLKRVPARWKANFVAATVRLIIYPVLSYVIVWYCYRLKDGNDQVRVDPWCIPNHPKHSAYKLTIQEAFSWDIHDSAVFGVHIVASFIAYIVQKGACLMTLHRFGLALPVFLASPISMAVYVIHAYREHSLRHAHLFWFFTHNDTENLSWSYISGSVLAFALLSVLWIGQILITGYNLFISRNAILSSEEDMFVQSRYNSVFLEQHLAINRCVNQTAYYNSRGTRKACQVFICSTMYRENVTEMKQLLCSLYKVATYYKKQKDQYPTTDSFESHIFFDGGCKGNVLSQFATQLMSLVPDVMKVKLDGGCKQKLPYGYRLSWEIETCMQFVIHLKDNEKIKNKKRWSQVMYMNYIMKYLPKENEDMDLDHMFILTTDADIKFKPEAAVTLLDMLARDTQVGAVCARTHPKGIGILYWYQLFDYAIGHWLQKAAEHVLGSVLCCPGCFSMFRCSALIGCLPEYSSEVSDSIEFLTKDMGEDRWLCTLLIEKGWRLEYCAGSKNYTYCPEEFDEFFKQRRRWIPSTVANLFLIIYKFKKIAAINTSVGWLFIIYQLFVIVATLIAPATVILIISSGLQISFSVNSVAVNVVLILASVIYGLICLYSSQQTQLDVAKVMTLALSVVMAAVVVGILKEVTEDVIFLVESRNNETNDSSSDVTFPGESTIYVFLFAFIFFFTAILHKKEFPTIFHCLWYLLGLPSGYLLLLIYSTANLNSRAWGTREGTDDHQSIVSAIWNTMKSIFLTCLAKTGITSQNEKIKGSKETTSGEESQLGVQSHAEQALEINSVRQPSLEGTDGDLRVRGASYGGRGLEETEGEDQHKWLVGWLKDCKCPDEFYEFFVKEGFTKEQYVAGMSAQDLRDIGIQQEGFIRRLQKAIRKLHLTPPPMGIPENVQDWIIKLKMENEDEDYVNIFASAGYIGEEDLEHLPLITKEELVSMGVTKKAHLKRFLQGIENLKPPSIDAARITEVKELLKFDDVSQDGESEDRETIFWKQLLKETLEPTPESLTKVHGLKKELNSLRNSVMVALLLINLIWIIILNLFTIKELRKLRISNEFFGLVFLAVYGCVLIVQFLAMLLHRGVTLAHYVARLSQSLPVELTETL